MCGIFCSIQKSETCIKCLNFNEYLLMNRGPDLQNQITLHHEVYNIILAAYVLWLQGPHPIKQPYTKNKKYLLYNGDIFDGQICMEERILNGDTIVLFNLLSSSESILNSLKRVEGPYSLIYCVYDDNKIYFARDPFGRRSLLIGYHKDHLIITSVCKRDSDYSLIELPCIGLFVIDLSDVDKCILFPWNISSKIINDSVNNLEQFLKIKITVMYDNYDEPMILHKEPKILTTLEPLLEYSDPNLAYMELLEMSHWNDLINELYSKLKEAVHKRVSTQPKQWNNSVGVLFSGGLDCTILTALIHENIPIDSEIHLFNVAFEKQNVSHFNTPDRQMALKSLNELQRLFPNRKFILFEINITQKELNTKCSEHITHLINPLESVLDDSLGCALWFASRGQTESQGKSPCRLLFVGMGADELFAGYTRHKNAFKRKSWLGLSEELQQDWNNLPHRNLARDDRVISDHGRQLRTPYLDENVVKFVFGLPVWERCFLAEQLQHGIGDKLLLRLLAFHLGFREVPFFRKRALQFGCRIANSKENAKDVSTRLKNIK